MWASRHWQGNHLTTKQTTYRVQRDRGTTHTGDHRRMDSSVWPTATKRSLADRCTRGHTGKARRRANQHTRRQGRKRRDLASWAGGRDRPGSASQNTTGAYQSHSARVAARAPARPLDGGSPLDRQSNEGAQSSGGSGNGQSSSSSRREYRRAGRGGSGGAGGVGKMLHAVSAPQQHVQTRNRSSKRSSSSDRRMPVRDGRR